MTIDVSRSEIQVSGRWVDFSRKQLDVMAPLYCSAGSVCPRDEIIGAA